MATTYWQLRRRRVSLESRPAVMGIVNVTPDSFSDGGQFADPACAIDHALRLEAEGADILDIGGESTRPYATPVPVEEELRRVLPVVRGLMAQARVPISVDTRKPEVAAVVLDEGIDILNDVEGFRNAAMVELAVRHEVGVCVMHMRGTPATMQDSPSYTNVVEDVAAYLRAQKESLVAAGLSEDRVCVDPGIGFGKTTQHNIDLLRGLPRFRQLDAPILIGHSRKGFLGKLLGDMQADRSHATIGVGLAAVVGGCGIVRVHDVRAFRQALDTFLATWPRSLETSAGG